MNRPVLISLYSGAGGLDYGFEAAGFETSVAIEMDHQCCETLRQNRKWPVIESDIMQVSSDAILETAGLKRCDADLLIGGPPCQPFSKAGYWAKGDSARLGDPRANTLGAYLRVLEETLPKTFLLENVEGLAYRNKDEGLTLLLDAIGHINERTGSNYRPEVRVLHAAAYGVPQLRKRVFIVGSRDGRRFEFPTETHGEDGSGLAAIRTAWDALADVEIDAAEDLDVRGKWAKLLPSIPEGSNYLHHTERGGGLPLFGWRTRYWSFLLKLAKNQPSWTVQAQPGPAIGPFHWENRRLSMRELCRIQTFPDDVQVTGSRMAQQRQIGNAVPSLLGEVLGRSIRTQLLELAPLRGPLKLLPPDRSPAPLPEEAKSVPSAFRQLMGAHAPHPGTGLGPSALSRESAI